MEFTREFYQETLPVVWVGEKSASKIFPWYTVFRISFPDRNTREDLS